MAKGQKRSGCEPKKPKKDRPKAAPAPRSSPFASMQDGQEAAPTPTQNKK